MKKKEEEEAEERAVRGNPSLRQGKGGLAEGEAGVGERREGGVCVCGEVVVVCVGEGGWWWCRRCYNEDVSVNACEQRIQKNGLVSVHQPLRLD